MHIRAVSGIQQQIGIITTWKTYSHMCNLLTSRDNWRFRLIKAGDHWTDTRKIAACAGLTFDYQQLYIVWKISKIKWRRSPASGPATKSGLTFGSSSAEFAFQRAAFTLCQVTRSAHLASWLSCNSWPSDSWSRHPQIDSPTCTRKRRRAYSLHLSKVRGKKMPNFIEQKRRNISVREFSVLRN